MRDITSNTDFSFRSGDGHILYRPSYNTDTYVIIIISVQIMRDIVQIGYWVMEYHFGYELICGNEYTVRNVNLQP